MNDCIEDIARRLAFWHGQKIVREGGTLAGPGGGEWGDGARTYAQRHWQEYTAAARYVDELVKGVQEDLRRVVMTWDLPGPVSIVKAMDHVIGIARTRLTDSSSLGTLPASAGAADSSPHSVAA
jgi:hypothetical protein